MNETNDVHSIIIQPLLDALVEKNPLFSRDLEGYRVKLSAQYELYLLTELSRQLEPDLKRDFDSLLVEYPLDRRRHNAFLVKNIENIEDKIVDLSQGFVETYLMLIQSM